METLGLQTAKTLRICPGIYIYIYIAWLRATANRNLGLAMLQLEVVVAIMLWLGIPIFPAANSNNALRFICDQALVIIC